MIPTTGSSLSLLVLSRLSLAMLWGFTALTSLFWAQDLGYEILAGAEITGAAADVAIVSGSILDTILALWLISGKQLYRCCQVQILVIVIYSVLLTIIDAGFWLHPFGPLTKNIPILVLIGWLAQASKRKPAPIE